MAINEVNSLRWNTASKGGQVWGEATTGCGRDESRISSPLFESLPSKDSSADSRKLSGDLGNWLMKVILAGRKETRVQKNQGNLGKSPPSWLETSPARNDRTIVWGGNFSIRAKD